MRIIALALTFLGTVSASLVGDALYNSIALEPIPDIKGLITCLHNAKLDPIIPGDVQYSSAATPFNLRYVYILSCTYRLHRSISPPPGSIGSLPQLFIRKMQTALLKPSSVERTTT